MLKETIYAQGKSARQASRELARMSEADKNAALGAMADALEANVEQILERNRVDLESGRQAGLTKALTDRLMLNEDRIRAMAAGLRQLISLKDPVGETDTMFRRPNGLEIGKVRVPLGVVGMIYEARPNVTVDAAGLCLKTGNAVILRGGSTAQQSNRVLTNVIAEAATAAGVPAGAISLIDTTDREAVDIMLRMNEYLDVLIPRGGAGLIQNVVQNATVPVIETGVGNCHGYVDEEADLTMAVDVVVNSKTQRPGVCNALETVLVHQNVAGRFLPALEEQLVAKGVEIRACERSGRFLRQWTPATTEDWKTEYLDAILACRVVDSMDEALEHIHTYGTRHSETILTENYHRARRFLSEVDAAAVYVNASTRFTDGEQFGFGAEIGISTQKLHARGPMGLRELTTYKYVVYGDGQVRG